MNFDETQANSRGTARALAKFRPPPRRVQYGSRVYIRNPDSTESGPE